MKRMIVAIALLVCTAVPAAAGNNNNNQFNNWQHNRQYNNNYGNQYNQFNQYNYKYKNNSNNYNGWQAGAAVLGGMLVGGLLNDNRGYYAPPPPAYQPYPQPYQAGPLAGPRYCESMLYYDEWGNLVQSRNCYR